MEKEFIRRCISGDRLAQIEFYDSLCNSIYNTCYRIIKNQAKAEEVAHESFIKIFDRLDRYVDNPESIIYALRRIAINGSIDVLRKKRITFVEIDERQKANVQDSVADESETALNVTKIKNAIEKLPTGYRVVVTLKLIEQMGYEEISQELNITQSTARSQYKRAIEKLKQML